MKSQSLVSSYIYIYIPLIPLLSLMEATGIYINKQILTKSQSDIQEKMKELEQKAWKTVGIEFLLSSPKQVSEILYDHLHLDKYIDIYTEKGSHRGTGEDILQALSIHHPLPSILIAYRRLHKIETTYITGLLQYTTTSTNSTSMYIYNNWNLCQTGTGRLSTSQPNIQSLPKNSLLNEYEESGIYINIRDALGIERKGYIYISIDYKQIEMRVMGHYSQDIAMKTLFDNKKNDIYTNISSYIYNKPVSEINKQERNKAKVITLGLCYGMGSKEMANRLGISLQESNTLKNTILKKFPGLSTFIRDTKLDATKNNFISFFLVFNIYILYFYSLILFHIQTIFGRRRLLSTSTSRDQSLSAREERQSVNSIIQGTAADLLYSSMILLWNQLEQEEARIIMQIHDELIIECKDTPEKIERVTSILKQVLEHDSLNYIKEHAPPCIPKRISTFSIPLDTSISVGHSLGTLVEYEEK
ncbi:hypothetical protein WA158_002739 [Blastocystis sp. Blastoise]